MGIKRVHLPVLAAALAIVFAAGCGGGDGGSDQSSISSLANDRLKEQAAAKAKRAADKVVRATHDKNLPGPKRYLSVCVQRGDPQGGEDVPPNVIKCHIEAFSKGYGGTPPGYIWSEDWHVPIQDGKLGTPVISGDYRIRNFLREDNRRNCIPRHQPRECLPQSVGGVLPG